MTVQRQYTLPNCNLKLEGLAAGDESDPMAPLTVVLNTECEFPGTNESLSGGREFLNALVKTVSDYAQSILSGVPYPLAEEASESQPVTLQPADNHRHHLMAMVTDMNGQQAHKTLKLNSVQLFDLVEAVDQLLADTLTLPDMTIQLSPLHRRHARPTEPASKRILPVATGLSALAASAALLFLLPIPEFEPQRPTREDPATSGAVDESPAGTDSAAIAPVEEPATDNDDVVVENNSVDPVAAGIALGRLASAPTIADSDVLDDLGDELEETLVDNLSEDWDLDESLEYRVAVSETGDILGYKYENEAALDNIDSTPLPQLTYIPVEPTETVEEPIAQFLVTFETDGAVTAEAIAPEDED